MQTNKLGHFHTTVDLFKVGHITCWGFKLRIWLIWMFFRLGCFATNICAAVTQSRVPDLVIYALSICWAAHLHIKMLCTQPWLSIYYQNVNCNVKGLNHPVKSNNILKIRYVSMQMTFSCMCQIQPLLYEQLLLLDVFLKLPKYQMHFLFSAPGISAVLYSSVLIPSHFLFSPSLFFSQFFFTSFFVFSSSHIKSRLLLLLTS